MRWEPTLNLASESGSFLVLQPLGVGLLLKAEQHHHLDNLSIALCTHPPQGDSHL